MADEGNLLSTPAGYATPQQIAAMRDYAKALMQPGQIRPLAHWAPAVADAVRGLTGGYQLHRAGERELQSMDYTGGQKLEGYTGTQSPPTAASGGPRAGSEGTPSAPLPAAGTTSPRSSFAPEAGAASGYLDPATYGPGLSNFESGGRYDNLGPIVPKTGDRAHGKYQVMGANIGPWTQEALGTAMTPQQFLADKNAQEAVYKHKFGQYLKQYGNPQDAASMWFTGKPYAQGRTLKDQLGTTGEKYINSTVGAAGSPQQAASALAFTGEPAPAGGAPDPTMPDLPPTLLAAAARGATPTVTGRGSAAGAPGVTSAQPLPRTAPVPGMSTPVQLPPGIIAPRVSPPPSAMRHVLGAGAGYTAPWEQQLLTQLYLQRNQPQEMAAPGGKVIVPAGGGGTGHFVPELRELDVPVGEGGTKPAKPVVRFDPATQSWVRVEMNGSTSPAGFPAPPGAAAPDFSDVPSIAPVKPPTAAGGPATPPASTGPRSDVPVAPGTPQTAELEQPEPDAMSAMALAPPGEAPSAQPGLPPSLLNLVPPGETMPPEITTGQSAPQSGTIASAAAALPAGERGPQFAQNIDPRDRAQIEELNAISREHAALKERNSADVKAFQTQYDLYSNAAKSAARLQPNIGLAKTLVDSGAVQGFGADARLDWDRFKAWALNDPAAAQRAGVTQAFTKTVANSILDDMKTTLQGLGQVRVAEIQLLNQAAPSIYNEPEANKAILDLQGRVTQMAIDAGKIASLYNDRGITWDKDGRPMQRQGRPTRGELDSILERYLSNHPSKMTPEQQAQYLEILAGAKERMKVTGAAPAGRGVPSQQPQPGRTAAPSPELPPLPPGLTLR